MNETAFLKYSLSSCHGTNYRCNRHNQGQSISKQSSNLFFKTQNSFSSLGYILRATTHDPLAPPTERHIASLLSFGHSSRATASQVIEALIDRLQSTHDASVAIKCLITVHRIVKQGSFILQDQLSIYPSNGGRNHLKLSNFRDNSSPVTWELSSWVRWYARYLEHLLSTSRILGFFLGSSSSSVGKDDEEERASALTNSELVKEIDSLASLLEEMCTRPDLLYISGNKMVEDVMDLVGGDYLSAINHVSVRVDEFTQRLTSLSFNDSVELVCALKRLECCKEKMSLLSTGKKALIEKIWRLVSEMKSELGLGDVYRDEGRSLLSMGSGLGEKGSESARFGARLLGYNDSMKFSSARFGLNSYSWCL